MTTKERILYESLNLFSIHGYEAVSMRDIGAAVGIRESSIYKHYAGKQAILDSIVEKSVKEMDNMFVELGVPNANIEPDISQYSNMDCESIANLCVKMLLNQLDHDIIRKFRRLLTIEQYRNTELKKIHMEMFMERQLQYNEKVFEYLLRDGVLKGYSPRMMALEFYSPFFMLQYRYDEDKESLEKELKEHAVTFIKEHMRED